MTIEQSYNFRRIDDRITTSGVVPAEVLEQLASEGYGVVINLLPEDSQYAVANEHGIVEQQGIGYVYIPVDFASPGIEDFAVFEAAMQQAAGKKVHVHCAANYRVSAFYALYAMKHEGWSQSDADALIGSLWNPGENAGWPEFIDVVKAS